MDRARSVQLAALPTRWLEVQLFQYLLHRDLVAQRVEVHSRHGSYPWVRLHIETERRM
jgi:hypothetical protein